MLQQTNKSGQPDNNTPQVLYCNVSTRDQVTNEIIGEYLVKGTTYQVERLRSTVNRVLLSSVLAPSNVGYQQAGSSYNEKRNDVMKMRHSFASDKFHIHVLVDDKHAYSCVAFSYTRTEICYNCLERVQKQLQEQRTNKLNLQAILASSVQFVNDPANSKILNAQNQIGELKGIMLNNVDKILDNMEYVDQLSHQTERLNDGGETFLKKTNTVKNHKMGRMIVFVLILLLIIGIVLAAGGFTVYMLLIRK